MDSSGVRSLTALAVTGVLLTGCGAGAASAAGTAAAGGSGAKPGAAAPAKAHTCPLQVRITSTGGSTWGSVTATFAGKTQVVRSASGSVAVPCGRTVSLAQKAVSSKTWPFSGWLVSGDHGRYAGKRMKAKTIQVKVDAATQVQAQYRLRGAAAAVSAKAGGAKASTKAW